MTVNEQRTMDAIQSINRKTKDSNTIDWEQRRYEIAKDMLNGIVSALPRPYPADNLATFEEFADLSVRYADALVAKLKKSATN